MTLLLLFLFILVPHWKLYAKESISLEVQPVTADKVWNTTTPRDQNPNGLTDTWYYPWVGDDNVTVTGFQFINLTEKKSSLIEKYGITIDCDLENDIQSAITDMNFLGSHPVTIVWNNKPTLKIEKEEQAEEDGYIFVIKVRDGVCNVVDNGQQTITEADWDAYYEKAKESCKLIMEWQEAKGAFGSKENPSYEGTDPFNVLAAARCGYIPYDDPTWFDRWFVNTKAYVEELGEGSLARMQSTTLAKLILAIEAIGYDPRDIPGIDLLSIEGKRNIANMYRDSYAIFSLKAAGYSTDTFSDEEIEAWVHNTAKNLKNSQDVAFKNPDNTIGWQPLVYWYGKEGFEDVTEALDFAVPKLAAIGQRATGGICTEGYETACPMYGNNAWNIAQTLLFTGDCGVNVLRPESGFTKNGNNVLDATFDLMNYEERTIPGFVTYDPSQVARGLNAFIREYERDVLGKDTAKFWIFSDVEVPTRPVNDAILALSGKSTDEEIAAARAAYEALDDTHKAIFNQEYYQKLTYYETGGRDIEAAKEAISQIPDYDSLSLDHKDQVLTARAAYDSLAENDQNQIDSEAVDKLVRAEDKIEALETESQLLSLNKSSTDEEIAAARAAYDKLTEDQRNLIKEAGGRLAYYESGGKFVDPVKEQIDALPDAKALKLSDKSGVTAAKAAYNALDRDQQSLLPQDYLDKLSSAEKAIEELEKAEAAKSQTTQPPQASTTQTKPVTTTQAKPATATPSKTTTPAKSAVSVKKGTVFVAGKYKYKVTKLSGKTGEATFTGTSSKKLSKVSIPATVPYEGYSFKVTAVGPKALSGYKKLTAVTIGKNVKILGKSVFYKSSKLKKITIKSSSIKKVGVNAFKGIHQKAVIKVPGKKLKAYKKLLKGKGQKKTVRIK